MFYLFTNVEMTILTQVRKLSVFVKLKIENSSEAIIKAQ